MKYNNTKDALAAIYRQFGADKLLGRLNAYLADLVDSDVSDAERRLAYAVFENGAAALLKNKINEPADEQETAMKKAIQKLTDAFIAQSAAEKIIGEFAAALGWKTIPVTQEQPKPQPQQEKPKPQSQPQPKPQPQTQRINYPDGSYYIGETRNGKPHGKGKKIWNDGENYDGYWVDGKKHGKGKYTWANGKTYEGDWVDNKKQGKGITISSKGALLYDGDWFNDNYHGKGKLMYENGNIYEGDWVNQMMHGKGKMTYANGRVEEGKWNNDKYLGK
jgi:hypothetical protein